jgi:hypothetical protein
VANDSTDETPFTSPRYAKSPELLGAEVEILGIYDSDGQFGQEYLYDVRKPDGEVVSHTRKRDAWRAAGVAAMTAELDAGKRVFATLAPFGKAYGWKPYDERTSRMSPERAARLRQNGVNVRPPSAELPADDSPPPQDEDAPAFTADDVPW